MTKRLILLLQHENPSVFSLDLYHPINQLLRIGSVTLADLLDLSVQIHSQREVV